MGVYMGPEIEGKPLRGQLRSTLQYTYTGASAGVWFQLTYLCCPVLPEARTNSCHGGHRVGRGRCWTSHAVRFADNTILSYLINVVPSIQCCVPVFSSGLRSAVRRRLTSGRSVVSVVRINSDIIGELTRHHCVHLYGSYAFRTSYR